MALKVIFPKLAQPIEVPAGEQLHALNRPAEAAQAPTAQMEVTAGGSQAAAIDVHQTIVDAVDVADASVPERIVSIGEEEIRASPLRPSKTGIVF